MTIQTVFEAMRTDAAPGQEVRAADGLPPEATGETLRGSPVDFSHGDVDAHPPTPGARETWLNGFSAGGRQAYTEYRGDADLRNVLAGRLAAFTGAPVNGREGLILTPGTQGALFLAMGACVTRGTKVAVLEPDYFANRKMAVFLGGEVVPVPFLYGPSAEQAGQQNGPDLNALEAAFADGVKVLIYSTPNNPTGAVTGSEVTARIASLAAHHGVAVIVDQLYARMLYPGETFTHLRALPEAPASVITVMGPSKTESLSGFRLGAAFGSPELIDRMEKLQAIVSLRAAGYSQAALQTWFDEPEGWMGARIEDHRAIRDDLLKLFHDAGWEATPPQAGSYLYPRLPPLSVDLGTFTHLLRFQAAVIVTPGTEFAAADIDRIRLNFSQDHAAAVAAAGRIVALAKRYAA
ncbi:pyridoxal phosphate-dependent aminotransferase [Ruegeria sp. EL01]|jgi:aspartate/methionine/tyrosine aminotransferase|uniref:pyridoxal phosphate-dependent aminotransferase n=1 Tax=Ruegeria sp. EL01 TaxID=2107578 RepID=UPI000EA81FE0|nr:pyridoxal phosphate-dependent aminotransferase [Ruegeria sp. EL01]